MLIVRAEQLSAFSRVQTEQFERWMAVHLNRFFPAACARQDEAGVQETIRYGIERAAAYKIFSKRDVCKYIDVMILFGRDFDRDPRLPWATAILARPGGACARMNALIENAIRSLKG